MSHAIVPPAQEQHFAADGILALEPGGRSMDNRPKLVKHKPIPASVRQRWCRHRDYGCGVSSHRSRLTPPPFISSAYSPVAAVDAGACGAPSAAAVCHAGLGSGFIEVVRRQARKIGLRFVPVVAWCQRVSTPIVVGIVTPANPASPRRWRRDSPPDQLSASSRSAADLPAR